jgi:hypothetical protein
MQKAIGHLPDKIMIEIFSYLKLSDVCRIARVCKTWRLLAYDGRLWSRVSLRPDFNGLHVQNIDALVGLISVRFGPTLRYIELSAELVTPNVLHELANRWRNLHSFSFCRNSVITRTVMTVECDTKILKLKVSILEMKNFKFENVER